MFGDTGIGGCGGAFFYTLWVLRPLLERKRTPFSAESETLELDFILLCLCVRTNHLRLDNFLRAHSRVRLIVYILSSIYFL